MRASELTLEKLEETVMELRKRATIFYIASPHCPKLNGDGDEFGVVFTFGDDNVFVFNPDYEERFIAEVRAKRLIPELYSFDGMAERWAPKPLKISRLSYRGDDIFEFRVRIW